MAYAAALTQRSAAAKDIGGGWEEKKKDGRVVQELKIEAPTMTEEDQYGYVMPKQYACDSCRAVVYHLNADLKKKHPKSRKMKEWEYAELFDNTCRSAFEGYGIKLVNGKNKLSGVALQGDSELAPGSGAIQMGGETWSKRLGELCRTIIYDKVGEDELYHVFKEEGELGESICYSDAVRDCTAQPLGPVAPAEAKPAKAKDKAKKESAKAKAKKEKQKAKEAMAEKAKAAKADSNNKDTRSTAAEGEGNAVDVQTFLRGLAVKHGSTSDEYLTARTTRDWEKLMVAVAGRIFNKMEL